MSHISSVKWWLFLFLRSEDNGKNIFYSISENSAQCWGTQKHCCNGTNDYFYRNPPIIVDLLLTLFLGTFWLGYIYLILELYIVRYFLNWQNMDWVYWMISCVMKRLRRFWLNKFFHYHSIEKVPKITSPVLVIHGTEDNVVDFSHGLAIHERCPRAVEPLWVEVRLLMNIHWILTFAFDHQ